MHCKNSTLLADNIPVFCRRILEEIYGRYARELDQNKVEVEKANQELQEKKAKKCDQLRALFKND